MGSDDLHNKRKKRNLNSFKRSKAKREPYETVLIVCEGQKTEVNYLKGLCEHLKINSIKIIATFNEYKKLK